MLFVDHEVEGPSTLRSPEVVFGVCSEQGLSTTFGYFEYIRLLLRIRAWIRDLRGFFLLFRHRHDACVGDCSRDVINTDFYEDSTDSSFYKGILDRNDGQESCIFDVFTAPPADGFQSFGNQSFETWPIVALNMNLAPSHRFLMSNVITFFS